MTHSLYTMLLHGLDFTELILNIFDGTVTRLWARESRGTISGMGMKYFLICRTFVLAVGSTHPPFQWVPGALASAASSRCVQLTPRSM